MTRTTARKLVCAVALLAMIFSTAPATYAYSVLSHQAIIDTTWDDFIKPVLVKRFPGATAEQLIEAHAHAYGGSIIQDMGYYPLASKFFSDLVHYVRSGDFIEALIEESRDLNEYAFALGALAHYAADNIGHSVAVNRAVPIVYPGLRTKYGDEVTYEESPSAHIKTEFGFDVLQVARGRYAPEAYHDFIGFKVSEELLKRSFVKTYSIELKDVFASLDLAIGTYRRTVSTVIPEMTKVAWETKKEEIEKLAPGITREKFVYNLSRANYEKEWGKGYEKPGMFAKTLSFFFRIAPKVGPFKALAFKPPTPETERMFKESFDATVNRYRAMLGEVRAGKLELQNKNFDTGDAVRPGEYRLADKAYAKLLEELEEENFNRVTPDLRNNILAFYGNATAPVATKKDKKDWLKTLRALDRLKSFEAQPPVSTRR